MKSIVHNPGAFPALCALAFAIGASQATAQVALPDEASWIATHAAPFAGPAAGDGIIWHNASTGACVLWLMNGTSVTSTLELTSGGGNWQVDHVADFNGDGCTDILWTDTTTGTASLWLMNGTTVSDHGTVLDGETGWRVHAVADFDGDQKADLLCRETSTGALAIWLMNGTSVAGGATILNNGSDWSVIATADFNADGCADLLWRNAATTAHAVWLINGLNVADGATLLESSGEWAVFTTADFDADHKADLLWCNTGTGAVAVWLMNGVTVAGGGTIHDGGSGWGVVSTGDFNGDGCADLDWSNAAGDHVLWFMNGVSATPGGTLASGAPDWNVILAGDFNRDGQADLIWRNQVSGETVLWLISGGMVTGSSGMSGGFFHLTATAAGPGSVGVSEPSDDGFYPAGTFLTATATPDPGAVFMGWSGDRTGTTNPLGFTLDAHTSFVANFEIPGVHLSSTAFAFPTPDLSQALSATVTGTTSDAVTWASANTYIATVSPAGDVRSVSGGTVNITATSVENGSLTAACAVTVSEPDRPRAASYTDPASITSGPVNIIMCGDSTMRTYVASASDQTGWGQVLEDFLSSDATVNNAMSNGGRSSRSFYNEAGRWDQVKTLLSTATVPTFVFIQFAHNDQKKTTDTNGADYLTFARTNQNGTTAGTYYDYLERYIVETRELGGIPVLFTPFVRSYLEGGSITTTGQHNITSVYPGETAARGDYPAAMKEIAAKHDVPVIDLTTASKAFVEAHSADGTLEHIYITGDSTHERMLGALLLAKAAVQGLADQGILTSYIQMPGARLMMDASTMSFGSIFTGTTRDMSFKLSAYGDASGTIDITAPDGYSVSTDGTAFASTAQIACGASWVGATVYVRFAPTAVASYNGALTVAHSVLTPDYGNTPPNATAGTIDLTGIGKETVSGAAASATWPLVVSAAWSADPATEGAISAGSATLVGLTVKDVSLGARLTTTDGSWPAESSRNASRYIQFTVPVSSGNFSLDTVAMKIGSGGGSNMQWDIVYSLNADFSSPVALVTTGMGSAKNVLDSWSQTSIGLPVAAGTTLYLRVYPYNKAAATGKYLLLQDVSVSGVTY